VPSFAEIASATDALERVAHHADGRWFLRRVTPYMGAEGTADGVLVTFVDISTQKRAEEALRAALEFNRRVLDSSDDCIKVLSLDARLESMSSGGICVMEPDDFSLVRGAYWPDFWEGEGREAALTAIEEARQGRTGRFRGPASTAKGKPNYWDVVVTAIFGADGRPEKLLSISRDITDQRRAEEGLRDAATVVENMAEAFLVLGPDFRVRQKNAEAVRIDGRPVEAVLGRHLLDVAPEVADLPSWPVLQRAMAERTAAEIVYRHTAEDFDVWIEVRMYPAGDGLAIFIRDVTDRERRSRRCASRTNGCARRRAGSTRCSTTPAWRCS
jgi:PAS domain-containing protein